jgi:predicted nuclease with TOPRIM domain
MDAKPGRLAVPVGQHDVEHLDVDLADVAAHPVLEHLDQEPALPRG